MMKNQSKYVAKTISALSLGFILLTNTPLVVAKDNSSNQAKQQLTQSVKHTVVNLNNSTFEQLVTLKGIGHTKAQAILVYRKQVGGFKSVKELSKVSGIGEKIISDNKSRLTI